MVSRLPQPCSFANYIPIQDKSQVKIIFFAFFLLFFGNTSVKPGLPMGTQASCLLLDGTMGRMVMGLWDEGTVLCVMGQWDS
jgi:hypothetical protein